MQISKLLGSVETELGQTAAMYSERDVLSRRLEVLESEIFIWRSGYMALDRAKRQNPSDSDGSID